ncbi:hypothetical protein OPT61_g5438 [Boeremia exigua]|uniref:Uncharacterized protein n=1 Tax=Boeremia exigua TaxID=749465 RepID=A0ACC2IA92_9PLEO|nr:hypothetical protein OPT61_g5438 [Boeremia exigua]
MPRRLRREDYTVGWVCALPVELAAAQAMLDEEHETILGDTYIYPCGRIGNHNIVLACLPKGQTGTNPAASVAAQMQKSFKSIRFGLMVGIGGGVPSKDADIRLGDVVVSTPYKKHGGVVQYDFGKTTPSGFEQTGFLNSPPPILLNATANLHAQHMRREGTLQKHISRLELSTGFGRDAAGPDVLFDAKYDHPRGETCDECDETHLVRRKSRAQEVVVHYGTIASGNRVMRSATERDRVSAELGGGVLCFEMEAAGLMNNFPSLVIRGICDYADSHKNKRWQPYAAGTAAAYARELLLVIPAAGVIETRPAGDAMSGTKKRCHQSPAPDDGARKRRKVDHHMLLSDEEREQLLESLKFDQIDARQMTIKMAHAKTCKWLLEDDQYLQWNDVTKSVEHHGFLWIKGKAGTGKSTLMKFACSDARRTMRDRAVLSFFFNARGEELEKSTSGVYRSLLVQLLKRFPELQSVFDSLDLLSSTKVDANYSWTIEILQMLFEQAIQNVRNAPVICFVDALDECEEEQIREMIQFFERIGDLALSNGICFQVCLSSRHYPHITIRSGLELVLEGQSGHIQDITNYIEAELKIGSSKLAQQIRAELQDKASGIFMWIVLVVGILNKESDCGRIHTLQRKLREIPSDLNALFHDILTRDTHNKDALIMCIQWILFAKNPLSPEQLYHAVLSGITPEIMTDWDPGEITADVIRRFILDSSKGLATTTVSRQGRVEFIHESVRDFLLKENGLGKIWPEYEHHFRVRSHEKLKQCCLNYINIDVPTEFLENCDYIPETSTSLRDIYWLMRAKTLPFFEYAVQNILYHADEAEGGGISQGNFLTNFPLLQWVKFNNLFESKPALKYTKHVSLLYVLAALDMGNLIRALELSGHCMDLEPERYGCPLFVAAAMNSPISLRLFSKSIDMRQADDRSTASVKKVHFQHWSAQLSPSYNSVSSFLYDAVKFSQIAKTRGSAKPGKPNVNSKNERGRTTLWWTRKDASPALVRSFLSAGYVMLSRQDARTTNLLCVAAEQGHTILVKVLLKSGANPQDPSEHYGNALQAASFEGYGEIVTLLLENGAKINAQGGYYGNALQAASFEGYGEIVTLLLKNGAKVNAQGGYYGNALHAAILGQLNGKKMVELLLDNGANVTAQGGEYGSALQAASYSGKKEVVALLLDRGADVNAQGGRFGNALKAASYCGHIEIVTLLRGRGAIH